VRAGGDAGGRFVAHGHSPVFIGLGFFRLSPPKVRYIRLAGFRLPGMSGAICWGARAIGLAGVLVGPALGILAGVDAWSLTSIDLTGFTRHADHLRRHSVFVSLFLSPGALCGGAPAAAFMGRLALRFSGRLLAGIHFVIRAGPHVLPPAGRPLMAAFR